MTAFECTHTIRLPDMESLKSFFRMPKFIEHAVTWSARKQVLPPLDDRARIDEYAAIAMWRCDFPKSHPAWDRYVITCVHLRDIKGAPVAHRSFAKATHELTVCAVNPDVTAEEWARGAWSPLLPINYTEQFATPYDHAAEWMAERAAEAFVAGRFPVEPGGITGARKLFAENVREWERQAFRIFTAR